MQPLLFHTSIVFFFMNERTPILWNWSFSSPFTRKIFFSLKLKRRKERINPSLKKAHRLMVVAYNSPRNTWPFAKAHYCDTSPCKKENCQRIHYLFKLFLKKKRNTAWPSLHFLKNNKSILSNC